ncbi:MAG: chemotaxis protein CheD [Anaeromyxobacteraceae bacterium]|nr:chemotaxis protein CheD [Anaeromyxobacteraceae bacterium]
MKLVTVSIGGLEVTADREATLITHGLGSCIAVMTYDPIAKVAGMLHFQLPTSTLSPERAKESPGTFADTGIPLLFERMYALGSKKGNILVKVAGGGNFHGDNGTFDIGKRNYTMMRKIFWKAQVLIAAEDCGGNRSRTARLFVDTGQITIQSGSEVSPL